METLTRSGLRQKERQDDVVKTHIREEKRMGKAYRPPRYDIQRYCEHKGIWAEYRTKDILQRDYKQCTQCQKTTYLLKVLETNDVPAVKEFLKKEKSV